MATANFKKFDVKHGISINGLPFVDQNRNVTVNDLTVQGVSTIVDTRSITAVDPIITLGAAGQSYDSTAISGSRIEFSAEAIGDIAIGDAISFDSGDITYDDGLGGGPVAITSGTVYLVYSRDTDPLSSNYRTIELEELGNPGTVLTGTFASAGATNTWTLNPLRDLDQDLGIAFNYVDGTPKTGFFGYQDNTGEFTFLLDATYTGSNTSSDTTSPIFSGGEKGGINVKNIQLSPTNSLTTSLPAINIDQNWNDGSVAFKAFTLDITDTASAASSSLLEVTVGVDKKLLLRKDGSLAINTSTIEGALTVAATSEDTVIYGSGTWTNFGTSYTGLDLAITGTSFDATSKLLNLSNTTTSTTTSFIVGAYGNISSSVEFVSGTLETALEVNVTDTSSAADSLLLDLQVGSTSKFSVDKDGDVVAAGSFTVNGGLNINGPGTFENYIDIEANEGGTYALNSRLISHFTEIAAGSNITSTIATFSGSSFLTGKYLIQLKQGSIYHSAEVLLIHDGSTAYITEYGSIYNTEIIGNIDAAISGTDVILTVTPTASIVSNNAIIEARVITTAMSL